MYKKIVFMIAAILSLLVGSVYSEDFAYFPSTGSNEASVSVSLCNLSEINTMTAKDAAFKLTFNAESTGLSTYIVEYKIDDNPVVSSNVEVLPSEKEKIVNLEVNNGIHTLDVNVKNGDVTVGTFSGKIYVMDLYQRRFMDSLSGRGIVVSNKVDTWNKNKQLNLNFMKNSGWRYARSGEYIWYEIEKKKGLYDLTGSAKWAQDLKSIDMKSYYCHLQGNGFLYPAEPNARAWNGTLDEYGKWLPQTKESLEGYAKFAQVMANYSKENDINFWELWNEADLSGQPDNIFPRTQAYADTIKSGIIRNLYDGRKIEYGLFTGTYDMNFYDYGYDCGLYPYGSTLTHHVYMTSGGNTGFSNTRSYETKLKDIENVIVKHGGWKDKAMSETGKSTPTVPGYPTQEVASWNIAKDYAACELYDYTYITVYCCTDPGTDKSNPEHCYGQIDENLNPKPTYLATVAFNNMTEGGISVGELDFGEDIGTRAFVYYRDGEPIIMAWSHRDDNSHTEWKLDGQNCDVYDYMGNKISSGTDTVSLWQAPVYIFGASKEYIAKAVKFEIEKRNKYWLAFDTEAVPEKINNQYSKEIESINTDLQGMPSAQTVMQHMNTMGQIAYDIIAAGKQGDLTELEVSRSVYEIYRIIQKLNKLYISLYDGDIPQNISDSSANAEEKADLLYRNNLGIMQYSDEMRRHAKKYADDINSIMDMEDNPSKAGVIAGYLYMEDLLCGWYDKFTEYETITNLGYQIQSAYYDRKSYANTDITTPYRVWNYSKKNFSGHIEIYNDKGELEATSKDFKLDGNGGYKELPITMKTKKPDEDSDHPELGFYDVCLVSDKDGVVSTQRTCYEVEDKFVVTSEPATQNVKELSEISMKIENVTDSLVTAHLKFESDGNFKFVQTTYDVEIEANSSATIKVPVTEFKETEYHFYTFKYEITDDNGNVIVDAEKPINFAFIVKSDKPIDVSAFNGDISDWSDAYPGYLSPPSKPADASAWKNAECSARVLMKWDDDNLYILGDVYDEAFLQGYNGTQMWQGDSMQVSFDPLNDGTHLPLEGYGKAYGPDDYELGFARTSKGNEFFAWKSPKTLQQGAVEWFKLLRDNEACCTRYLIKISRDMIENLKLEKGATISMNIALNDADLLQRERYIQFTKGTADKKDPDNYADFVFSDVKSENMTAGKASEVFPTKINGIN